MLPVQINLYQLSQGQGNGKSGPSQGTRSFFLGTVHCTNTFKANTLLLMKELKVYVTKSGLIPVIGDCLSFQSTHFGHPAASSIEVISFETARGRGANTNYQTHTLLWVPLPGEEFY